MNRSCAGDRAWRSVFIREPGSIRNENVIDLNLLAEGQNGRANCGRICFVIGRGAFCRGNFFG
jgi:hypothetical protein